MQNEAVALLRCPICSGSFHQEGKSLLCGKRHCYDIAKQGHVNFAPNAKPSFYKKELFESRARAFEAGVFAPVAAAVGEALEKYVRAERPIVADAGCGEGYYLRSVCPERDMIRIGFDLSKEAVLLAAKGDRRSTYFVGDLANIPLADGCCDAVLDVFTPANYAQFGRILKKDGVLIKLAPRPGYLRQLREAAGDFKVGGIVDVEKGQGFRARVGDMGAQLFGDDHAELADTLFPRGIEPRQTRGLVHRYQRFDESRFLLLIRGHDGAGQTGFPRIEQAAKRRAVHERQIAGEDQYGLLQAAQCRIDPAERPLTIHLVGNGLEGGGVFGGAAGDEHVVREAAEQLHRALKHVLAVAVNRETKLVPPHAGRQATRHDYSVHDASPAVPLKRMGMR